MVWFMVLPGLAQGKAADGLCRHPLPMWGPSLGDTLNARSASAPRQLSRLWWRPCAAVGKLEVACASWTWLRAERVPLLVPAVPLAQSTKAWLGQATLPSLESQHLANEAGSQSVASPWQCRG